MASSDSHQEASIRRIRSTGDIPRRPERVHIDPGSFISEHPNQSPDHGSRDHTASQPAGVLPPSRAYGSPQSPSITPLPLSSPPQRQQGIVTSNSPPLIRDHTTDAPNPQETNRPPQHPQYNTSLYVRVLTYFGLGRRASHARKSLVSLIWNVSWGFVQAVVTITMLILIGTHFRSPTSPDLTEWRACDRPLGIWASVWVIRVLLASGLAYWEFLRDRLLHPPRSEAESGVVNTDQQRTEQVAPNPHARPSIQPATGGVGTPTTNNTPDAVVLPHNSLYSRLTLLSSLITLSWFLTAHILEYTSINTCRHSSPHLWWLVFGILCIMYLMVLEVVLLGFVVLVVAPILFIFWNIFLFCIGRHPLQNPNMIKPEIGKLSKSMVERIPLVIYIPAPPEHDDSIPPSASHAYPPRSENTTTKAPSKRFKLLRNISSFRIKKNKAGDNDAAEMKATENQGPISWEEHWEQGEYPFVALEGNRAACAICLMDFEEPKKRNAGGLNSQHSATLGPGPESEPAITPLPIVEEERPPELKLNDAGDGSQPLRLLACSHVFHKTCLDPWLTDVSGRCPVCQRAVEIPKSSKRPRRSS